jgi:hypothetical protein
LRFLSPYRNYKLVAIGADWEPLPNGGTRINRPDHICEFSPWDAGDYERAIAKKHFHYGGTVRDPASNRELDPVDDQHRVSVYDTAQMQDSKLRKEVEEAMLAHPALGSDYILIEQPTLAPPYAKYPEHRNVQGRRTISHAIQDITQAAKTMIALGEFDVDAAVQYERANGNNAEVIAALEGLRPAPEPAEELVSA